MRANEFVTEGKAKGNKGKITKRQNMSTVGLNLFRDKEFADRIYELNRVMMAAACADGTNPINVNHESWAGRMDIAAPYSSLEQKMLSQAFAAVGSIHYDVNKGDLRSQELSDTNKISPVVGFKGFKK